MNPKTCQEELCWMPMLLIHEVVAALAAKNAGNEEFKSRESMAATSRRHLESIERCIAVCMQVFVDCGEVSY